MPGIAKEIKEEVVDKVKSGEPVTSLASRYGISNRTIYTWLRKKAEGSVSVLEFNKLKRENQQLKEIVGVLTLELEKTKKKK